MLRGVVGGSLAAVLGQRVAMGAVPAIGLLFLIFAGIGAFDYFTVLIFEEPIFALTNPFMMLIYYQFAKLILSSSKNANYVLHVSSVLLVPVMATVSMWLVLACLPDGFMPIKRTGFMDIYHELHGFAFGDLVKQFEYFPRMRSVSMEAGSNYWAFMWIIGMASAVWVFLLAIWHKQSMIELVSMHSDKPEYDMDLYLGLPMLWLVTGAITAAFYPVMIILHQLSLPTWITVALTWVMLLFPMYAVLLPAVNWNRTKDQRLASFIPKFYFVAFSAFLAFVGYKLVGAFEVLHNLDAVLERIPELYGVAALSPVWLFLFVYLIRNPRSKTEAG
ncbi:hypothetical protein [uncultured Alteromonas sp.]|jgi:hypothetical protein|uniref:hypothetical protein n=1 Tax=uncultured Alteromonas sp. TaxID=179113 RepID=UPI0025FE0A06|nr:hypothetical protein [uncultured Alteromonas sp.]